jgi:hypothetical protein
MGGVGGPVHVLEEGSSPRFRTLSSRKAKLTERKEGVTDSASSGPLSEFVNELGLAGSSGKKSSRAAVGASASPAKKKSSAAAAASGSSGRKAENPLSGSSRPIETIIPDEDLVGVPGYLVSVLRDAESQFFRAKQHLDSVRFMVRAAMQQGEGEALSFPMEPRTAPGIPTSPGRGAHYVPEPMTHVPRAAPHASPPSSSAPAPPPPAPAVPSPVSEASHPQQQHAQPLHQPQPLPPKMFVTHTHTHPHPHPHNPTPASATASATSAAPEVAEPTSSRSIQSTASSVASFRPPHFGHPQQQQQQQQQMMFHPQQQRPGMMMGPPQARMPGPGQNIFGAPFAGPQQGFVPRGPSPVGFARGLPNPLYPSARH